MQSCSFGFIQADDDDVTQIFELWTQVCDCLPDGCVYKEGTGTAIVQEINVIIGAQDGVHGHDYRTYFDCAEEGCDKLRRVEQ